MRKTILNIIDNSKKKIEMGGCCTSTNEKPPKKDKRSQSAAAPVVNNQPKTGLRKLESPGQQDKNLIRQEGGDSSQQLLASGPKQKEKVKNSNVNNPTQSRVSDKNGGPNSGRKSARDQQKSKSVPEQRQSVADAKAAKKMKQKQTFDVSPKIIRQFRIYNITNKQPVQTPYSRDTEWQQVLQLYSQKMNSQSFLQNLSYSSLKNKKQSEISNHLEQVQIHRDIELLIKILNLRNRNWVQEQIKMGRRLANMQPGSLDTLVVIREYLQLKEHFNWLVWAVSYYYFQMSKIEQFFQYIQTKQMNKQKMDTEVSASQRNLNDQRTKQQNVIYQEINHLTNQFKNLKTKLPSPISKKWTEGFNFQGVFFRMMPYSDSYFVRNEMKALKFMQTELKELNQIQNQIDMAASSFIQGQHEPITMYKQLIVPLLNGVECGGFFIFASPSIYIQDYDDDSLLFQDPVEENIVLSPSDEQKQKQMNIYQSNNQTGFTQFKKMNSLVDQGEANENEFFMNQQRKSNAGKNRSLTTIYGSQIYKNHKTMMKKHKGTEKSRDRSYSFLQDNLEDIDDHLLKMMPLLRNITKENVIPIIDFEDQLQTDLNYLLMHVYDCIPSFGQNKNESSTAVMRIPSDTNQEVAFVDMPDVSKVTVDDIKKCLKHKQKRQMPNDNLKIPQSSNMINSSGVNIENPFTNTRAQASGISPSRAPKTPQQVFKNPGGHQNDFSDESSMIYDSDFDSRDSKLGLQMEEDPAELFNTKCFTKHGYDIILISNNIENLYTLQNIQNTPFSKSHHDPPHPSMMQQNANNLQTPRDNNFIQSQRQNQNIIVNKRAQALYLAREEDSTFSGMFRKNQSNYVQSIVQFQASLAESTTPVQTTGYVVGGGMAKTNAQFSRGLGVQANKKQSILRKATNQVGYQAYGYGSGDSNANGPGMSSLFAEDQNHFGDDHAIQGNAVIIAQNSQSEFKLKYSLINHSYNCSLEQIFEQTIEQIAKILENTDTIFNIQSLKDLMHRKGLNLRFEWLLLLKVRSNFSREIIMIHILMRTMKRIINEELKLKAQVFTPNKPKPMNLIAPKSLADHQKQPKFDAKSEQQKQCDHFIGNNYENLKDNLVFFANTLLKRKYSKQKHVFDEALIGLFLSRLKVMPILQQMLDFSRMQKQNTYKDYEINYLQSKGILEDIISAPSQNPALFMNSLQTYFNVELDQEFLRKCRQDKYLFLSQLTSQPMVLNNISNVNLKNHTIFSLKEASYFFLANQMYKAKNEESRDQARLSNLEQNMQMGRNDSIISQNQNLRNNIFRNQVHKKSQRNAEDLMNSSMKSTQSILNDRPMGGAPGRRDNLQVIGLNAQQQSQAYNNDVLNSSMITDKNKYRQSTHQNFQDINNGVGNSSVLSRSSALNTLQSQQFNAQNQAQKIQEELARSKKNQMTPRQFNNIDEVDLRNYETPQIGGASGIQRQKPQILSLNVDQIKRSSQIEEEKSASKQRPEIIIPPILYKLESRSYNDANRGSVFQQNEAKISSLASQRGSNGNMTSTLLPFYYMPNHHVFNTWIMYLESTLKEVYSVEGSEQILLEALNYLAMNIYFGEGIVQSMTARGSMMGSFKRGDQSPLNIPMSPGSPGLLKQSSISSQRGKPQNIGAEDMLGNDNFDRDNFMRVCAKIKDVQAFTSKCSPEVLATSQIICGLNFEKIQDDSIFPIESEKSYLTALICMFQLIGDPRGRGNYSMPFMLLVAWKLSLMSLCIENKKVHDAEFSEELFDATLSNLSNHKTKFRKHQNDKLNRVVLQKEKINKDNLLNALSKESSIHLAGQLSGHRQNNVNSRRSNAGGTKDAMYTISQFEDDLDRDIKRKNKFEIKKYQNLSYQNFQQITEASQKDSSQNTPQIKQNLNNFQQSSVVQAGGFQNGSRVGNINSSSIPDKSQRIVNVSHSYQGGGFKNMLNHTSGGNPQPNAMRASQALNPVDPNVKGPSGVMQNSFSVTKAANGQQQNKQDLNSLLEANISEIDLEIDDPDEQLDDSHTYNTNIFQQPFKNSKGAQNDLVFLQGQEYVMQNFSASSLSIAEIPFIHWSIYRQSIQNVLMQQGHKFQRNHKQMNHFLSQMYKNVLYTAIDKKIFYPWFIKNNMIMYQSGIQWKNNQIKQAVFFQSAQMISSRSSSKSFQKDQSEYSLSLSIQGSQMSQLGGQSFRHRERTQNLGSYQSIINTENGSVNKGDIHGVLYTWGSDAQGQLGLDSFAHLTQKSVTQKVLYPRMVSVLKDEFIKEVCCGYSHTMAITIHGNVYSWGNNECAQLGLGDDAPEFVRKPKMIHALRNIVKLSAGNEHSVAINKNQELFSWGSMYQTGQNDSKNRSQPQRIAYLKSQKIQQVACGGLHTLALTKENRIYCWGSTEGGQLGLPTNLIQNLCRNEENAVKLPQQLVSLQDHVVTQVACGETHSICLCKDGSIFGWGLSIYGQLGLGFSSDSFEPGLGMEKSKVPEPRKIDTLKDEQICKIFCGSTFSLFLTKSGELYGCGMNDLGQLGEDVFNDLSALENARMGQVQTSDVTIPTQVSSLQGIQISTVACGEAHVLAIDGDGKDQRNMLWAWGQYKNGQLGLGEVNTKLNPRPVQNLSAGQIHKIACGSSHSLALVGDPSNVTTLSPNYYAANETLSNTWGCSSSNS